LTPVSGSTGFNSSYGGIGDAAIAPNGSFLYSIGDDTADEAVYDETVYTVNSSTGALTPVTGNPSVPQVAYIVVAPDSQFAYGADNIANVIWAYSINQTTGALSATSGSPYPVPAGPYPNAVVSAIAVDPSGKFLYVSIGGQVGDGTTGAYTINSSSGELTPVIGSPFTQGSSSQGGFSIAITALP
jgi:6-phosphogluconolactonase (cycloisomerase 2 family)